MNFSEKQKEKIREHVKNVLENQFQDFREVDFRDYSDEDCSGTVTKVKVNSHRDTVGTEHYTEIGVLQVKKLDGKKWELQLSPTGIRDVIL